MTKNGNRLACLEGLALNITIIPGEIFVSSEDLGTFNCSFICFSLVINLKVLSEKLIGLCSIESRLNRISEEEKLCLLNFELI